MRRKTASGPPASSVKAPDSARQRTIAVSTLGCRLNLYESDGLLGQFLHSGRYRTAESGEAPDITVINTCTVTGQADRKSRTAVEAVLRENPEAVVVVTGCFAQTDPEKAAAIPGVSMVIGNDLKTSLFEKLESMVLPPREEGVVVLRGEHPAADPMPGYGARPVMEKPFAYGAVLPHGHTRGYLKIQDGCDRACTYCKIPMARGRGTSRPVADVLDAVDRLVDAGVPEIVLTGVNLGWYRDVGLRFVPLLEKILGRLEGKSRLRLSSIEPCDVGHDLARLFDHPDFCPFLHIPLQSGSSQILRRMRRTYTPDSFRRRVEAVLAVRPDMFLGTDVMTGFPGESEGDFQDSYALCETLGMANIHAFRYSAREGTPAARMPGSVDGRVVRERMERLRHLRSHGFAAYVKKDAGKIRRVVVEEVKDGFVRGLSENFLRVHLPPHVPAGRGSSVRARIEGIDHAGRVIGSVRGVERPVL